MQGYTEYEGEVDSSASGDSDKRCRFTGLLDISAYNPFEAFVSVKGGGGGGGCGGGSSGSSGSSGLTDMADADQLRRIFIKGRSHMNRTVHGDEVVVLLLPEAQVGKRWHGRHRLF